MASGQRANLPAENLGCIVAVWQTVHHARCPLSAPVARVSAKRCKRQAVSHLEFFRRRLHQQTNFPMTGVISKGNRSAIGFPNSPLRAQDQKLFARKLIRVPTHAGVLAVSKKIAARGIAE